MCILISMPFHIMTNIRVGNSEPTIFFSCSDQLAIICGCSSKQAIDALQLMFCPYCFLIQFQILLQILLDLIFQLRRGVLYKVSSHLNWSFNLNSFELSIAVTVEVIQWRLKCGQHLVFHPPLLTSNWTIYHIPYLNQHIKNSHF